MGSGKRNILQPKAEPKLRGRSVAAVFVSLIFRWGDDDEGCFLSVGDAGAHSGKLLLNSVDYLMNPFRDANVVPTLRPRWVRVQRVPMLSICLVYLCNGSGHCDAVTAVATTKWIADQLTRRYRLWHHPLPVQPFCVSDKLYSTCSLVIELFTNTAKCYAPLKVTDTIIL